SSFSHKPTHFTYFRNSRLMRLLSALAGSLLTALASCTPAAAPHRTGAAIKVNADAPGDPAHSLLRQMTFEEGVMLPWLSSFGNGAEGTAQVTDGALSVQVEKK